MRDRPASRGVEPGDVLFGLLLLAYGALCLSLLPFDFQDLCYLFSLEQGRWVMQEWVHPIYVPLLDLFRSGLGLIGYDGRMLMPVEVLNVAALILGLALLYRLARRFHGASLAAVVTLSVTALSYGFWYAALRPTPYALAFLSQVISLLLLISDGPVPRSRYALAGVLAGVAMGLHASAMALGVVGVICALCDAERDTRMRYGHVVAFAGGMLAAAAACWAILVRYRAIGIGYFRDQDFASMFFAIEQMPGSSIWTSRSVLEQVTTFAETLRFQGGGLLRAALVVGLIAALWRWRTGPPLAPLERRLMIVTATNFAAIAAFFLINNTHNGFIFASLTLVPVALAVAVRDGRVLLVLLMLVAVPGTVRSVIDMRTGPQGPNEPLYVETQYLQRMLGPRDVLLTPGTPFPETLYLGHLNVFELSDDGASHPSPEVPVVRAGPELRARITWWRAQGGRVFYALGDESTDFSGDMSGATKAKQVFWRPETNARERAPRLQALRASLTAAGIMLRDPVESPNGQRYAELIPTEAAELTPPAAPGLRAEELGALFETDGQDVVAAYRTHRARYLAQLAQTLPGDPWHACDVMQLVCEGRPRRGGQRIPCEPSSRCAGIAGSGEDRSQRTDPEHVPGPMSCFWGRLSTEAEERTVDEYLAAWVESEEVGRLSDWGFRASGQSAELRLVLDAGALTLRWSLSDSCAPGPVTFASSGGLRVAPSEETLHALVSALPMPTVRAAVRSDQERLP